LNNELQQEPFVLTIASGKGGVGKSFIATNIAIHLSSLEKKVVLFDADLRGANLHSLLGLSPLSSESSFFTLEKMQDLNQLLMESGLENLGLISIGKKRYNLANLSYIEKIKITKGLKSLKADFVVIDTSSGTSYNTLDFFLLSPNGILITTADPLSIENLYQFIKAVIIRKIRATSQNPTVKKALKEWMSLSASPEKNLVDTFIDSTAFADKEMIENEVKNAVADLQPKLIINRTKNQDNRDLGYAIQKMASHYFGISIDYLGYVEEHQFVEESIAKKKPLILAYRESVSAKCIENITNLYLANYINKNEY
jgi:flagellar biosynthesis protein FlhG